MSFSRRSLVCLFILLQYLWYSSHAIVRLRYWSDGLSPEFFLTTQPTFLQYVSENNGSVSESVSWKTTASDCEIRLSSSNGRLANMTCASIGLKQIGVTRSDISSAPTDYVYINIQDQTTTGCYTWYVAVLDPNSGLPTSRLSAFSGPYELRVWIFDLERVSHDESVGAAALPSAVSSSLTYQYFNLGESPNIAVLSANGGFTVASPLTFNASFGYWTSTVSTFGVQSVSLSVASQGVSVFGCTVAARVKSLVVESFSTTLSAIAASFGMGPFPTLNQTFVFRKQACNLATALIFFPSLGLAYLTEDGYNTWNVINLQSLFNGTIFHPTRFIDAAFTSSALILLTDTGLFTVSLNGLAVSLVQSSALPSSTLDGVQTLSACDFSHTQTGGESLLKGFVSVWQRNTGSSFYVSLDSAANFVPLSLPSAYISIWNIHWLLNYNSVLVLVQDSPVSQLALVLDWSTLQWSVGFSFSGANALCSGRTASTPNTVVPVSGSGELFFFGDTVFYSPDGGISAQQVRLQTRSPSDPLSPSEYILQLETSAPGLFAVLTSTNRLFIGSAGLKSATEAQSGLPPGVVFGIFYDALLIDDWQSSDTSLFGLESTVAGVFSPTVQQAIAISSVTVDPSQQLGKFKVLQIMNDTVISRVLPTENEVLWQGGAQGATCPYLLRDDSQLVPLSYLDMSRNLTFNLTLVADVRLKNTISVAVSDSNLLSFTSSVTTVSAAPGTNLVSATRTVVVLGSPLTYANRSDQLARAQGKTDIRAVSTVSALPCEFSSSLAPFQRIAHVTIGCPPGRHIRVQSPLPNSDCGQSHGVGLFGSNPSDQLPSDTQYSAIDYGCPWSVYHQDGSLIPVLNLYDGDNFVETVPGDFVIWEATGRTDFTFTMSQAAAGCLSPAQTWQQMRAQSSSDDTAWTPENYQNCFSSGSSSSSQLGGVYQILNASSGNTIAFPASGSDGMFLFKVRVLDPAYSFCDLSARFAVNVYGAPITFGTAMTVVAGSVGCICCLLAASYVYYRKKLVMKKTD